MTIEEFAEVYNRNVEWNNDILSWLKLNHVTEYEHIRPIIDNYLTTEKITPETCDMSTAEVYDDDVIKEAHIYNYNDCHGMYYWTNPNETQKEYKKRKIESIREHRIKKPLAEIDQQIRELREKRSELEELGEILEKIL